jgi:probable lipoprotein NlpC
VSWSNAYIGIPFADQGRGYLGCDCWGLVRLVYQREQGITLPSYVEGYVCADERAEIDALIKGAQGCGPWHLVDGQAQPFDVLVFRRGRMQSHIGIATDRNAMLHVAAADQAKIERFDDPRWASRLCGVYRHAKIAGVRL